MSHETQTETNRDESTNYPKPDRVILGMSAASAAIAAFQWISGPLPLYLLVVESLMLFVLSIAFGFLFPEEA